MAELNQIVGAILRDITKARFSSDIYSRNISRYYEQDALLRRFPIPRSEIETVDIELKFSIADVHFEPSESENREATLAALFERHSDSIAGEFISAVLEKIDQEAAKLEKSEQKNKSDQKNWAFYAKEWVESPIFKIDLRQDILRYWMGNYTHLINKSGELVQDTASKELDSKIKETFEKQCVAMEGYYKEKEKDKDKEKDIKEQLKKCKAELLKAFEDSLKQMDLESSLISFKEDIKASWTARGDCRIEAEVTADKLTHMPEGAISTIKIKSVVRNYVWTQIERKSGKRVWRALNPE